jgi:hypothetical protein
LPPPGFGYSQCRCGSFGGSVVVVVVDHSRGLWRYCAVVIGRAVRREERQIAEFEFGIISCSKERKQKGAFLQNGGCGSILQKGSFSSPFSIHFYIHFSKSNQKVELKRNQKVAKNVYRE